MLGKVASDDSWLEATKKLGSVPAVLPPAETATFVEGQVKTFSDVAEKLNMLIE